MSIHDLVLNPGLFNVPTYVAGKSIDELMRELGVHDIIKLGSNENPLGASPKAIEIVQRLAAEMHYYPSVEMHDLRCKLADKVAPGLDADNVIVGNGSAEILKTAAQAFLHGGGDVVISRPAFQMYELATNMYGGQCIFVQDKNYHYDLDAMVGQITDQTRLVFVTNPNNPTGLFVTRRQVDDFMARVPPHVVVVFDEAYHEYADSPDYPDTTRYIREGRNVIITRTFSKVYGLAGMRVGYGIASRDIISYLLRAQAAFHTSRLTLMAAMAALDDEEHKLRTLQVNAEGKTFLYRKFDEMGLRYLPSQANYIMLIDLPHAVEAINQGLLKRGVILRPTSPFGIPQALRVTIGTPGQNARVAQTLGQVIEELNRAADSQFQRA